MTAMDVLYRGWYRKTQNEGEYEINLGCQKL